MSLLYPGSFKPGQRALYEALLEVQENCVRLAASHVSVELIFHEMLMMIGRQLQRLGIVSTRLRGQELVRVSRDKFPLNKIHGVQQDPLKPYMLTHWLLGDVVVI